MRDESFPSTPEAWEAWYYLVRGHGDSEPDIHAHLDKLATLIDDTFKEIPEVGLRTSIFSGEDDRDPPASRDVASYVLDHLIPNLYRCNPLAGLLDRLDFKAFLALLILHADRIGDCEAITRAHDVFTHEGAQFADQVTNWLRRKKGGRESGKSRREQSADRNQKVCDDARKLLRKGNPRHLIAGILATRRGLSVRQIRRILKKSDMN